MGHTPREDLEKEPHEAPAVNLGCIFTAGHGDGRSKAMGGGALRPGMVAGGVRLHEMLRFL